MRDAVEETGLDQKVVAGDLDVSPNYWTRMLSLTAEQKSFDLDRLLALPPPVLKAFVRRLAPLAGLAVVEPDARLAAVGKVLLALHEAVEVIAADARLPERSAGQLKARL